MFEQVLSSFEEHRVETFVDGTLGAGGHSAALIQEHPELHTLVGIDRDPTAHSIAEQTLRAASAVHPQPLDIRQLQARPQHLVYLLLMISACLRVFPHVCVVSCSTGSLVPLLL